MPDNEPLLVHNCGGGLDANGNSCSCSSPRPIAAEVDAVEHPDFAIHAHEQGLNGAKLTVDRAGAESRRRDSLRGIPTQTGFDRDELPPAMTVEGGTGAHVKYINPRDNRGAGSVIKAQVKDVPDGGTFILRIENLDLIGVTPRGRRSR
ncbi:NucA/NucB deoxyribonuclease domain-containing protein [Micromonospora violae]|uniref:NucA/NucB deoxyribonuclease domain-containing protein n=1 Tax=Micromonospora violae TaxID=1278207 RepID=UPI00102C869D|nr:NucA/NucB deoxyribonuclease domain-containing protein [Micromonospora violae]